MRIGIIGLGWVGTSVASSVLNAGIATELVLHDVKPGLAEGEAMDLAHGALFYPAAAVRAAASLDDLLRGVDAIVIAAGRGGSPSETRLELARDNADIVRSIAERLRGFSGVLVLVTNPVDVLTHLAASVSGMDPARVIGTGTMLDTARLRHAVGRELALDPRSIHAQVVGEHGDSEVVLWSSAQIGGFSLERWSGWSASKAESIAREVRTAAYEIIRRKGATNHAIGLVTASLLGTIARGERRVLLVSRVQEGACGVRDVALSLPSVVGADGAAEVIEPEMSDAEHDALLRSAEILTKARAEIA